MQIQLSTSRLLISLAWVLPGGVAWIPATWRAGFTVSGHPSRSMTTPIHLDRFPSHNQTLDYSEDAFVGVPPSRWLRDYPSKPTSPRRTWEDSFRRLQEYRVRFGNCRVPPEWPEDPKLGQWVMQQRYCRKKLILKRVVALNAIGFDWQRNSWWDNYDALKEYQAIHGDCLVPKGWRNDTMLYRWVALQRTRRNSLSRNQRLALDEIGFDWSLREAKWNRMYQRWRNYHEQYGDCHVTLRRSKDIKLVQWVWQQRKNCANGTIRPERLEKLGRLGFVSSRTEPNGCTTHSNDRSTPILPRPDYNQTLQEEPWLAGYLQLVEYSLRNGHCRIPSDGSFLATWVQEQRRMQSKGRLPPARKILLDRMRFEWNDMPQTEQREG